MNQNSSTKLMNVDQLPIAIVACLDIFILNNCQTKTTRVVAINILKAFDVT